MLGEMGISCLAVLIAFLQVQALICDKVIFGTEGQMFDFRCDYENELKNSSKHFCCFDIEESFGHIVRISKPNEWTKEGRISVYDNATAGYFIVRVEKLYFNDSGTYWCGDYSSSNRIRKIHLNVDRGNETPASTSAALVHKLTLQLFLTIIMCVGAMIFVCLFTICLRLAAKNRKSTPRQKIETSSDYETMMPTVRAPSEPCRCSHPDCADLSGVPRPPSDFHPCFTEEHLESIISCSPGEYVDVDIPGHICQYQHLDCSRLEEHVYHSLHGSSSPKEKAPTGQIVRRLDLLQE